MASRPLLCAAAAALLLVPAAARARVVLDRNDPAFAGGTTLPLTAASGFVNGMQHLDLTVGGVDLTFDNPVRTFFESNRFTTRSGSATTITFSPPVTAIGMTQAFADGCGGSLEIRGSAGTETVNVPSLVFDFFVGAADIGDIAEVIVTAPCGGTILAWSDLVFARGGGPPPPTLADLIVAPAVVGAPAGDLLYTMDAANAGPDAAVAAQLFDLPPPGLTYLSASVPATVLSGGRAIQLELGDLAAGASARPQVSYAAPRSCEATYVDVHLATSRTLDPDTRNNLATTSTRFLPPAGTPEICGNGIDDNCDGLADCGDPGCNCPVHVLGTVTGSSGGNGNGTPPPPAPPFPFVPGGPPPTTPTTQPAQSQSCTVTNPHTGLQIAVPPHCCEPYADCRVTDPNFKEADPPVNAEGFGYTVAGERIRYTVHYENIGTLDAHDVGILDALDPDLDAATLLLEDGGSYDAASRVIAWRDPLLPPHTPRAVHYSIEVRADAPPQTRVRNVATIVFPDGTPPSRIDTLPIEHVVRDPAYPIEPDLRVFRCDAAGLPHLVNLGWGFAHDVTAEIIDAAVTVTDGTASFAHPEDEPGRATVIPLAETAALDPVAFTGGSCETILWRIRWRDIDGNPFSRDVRWQEPPPPANQPPTCAAARPSKDRLWPPNHDFREVRIGGVLDPEGRPVSLAVTSIRQDEPTEGTGDGDRAPDGLFIGHKSLLRAERKGNGDGRVYHVGFTATDADGATCSGEVTVCVPRSRGGSCGDGGAIHDSTEGDHDCRHRGH